MKIMTEDTLPDIVVCVRKGFPTPFTDNVEGTCIACGHAVVFRPYVPVALPKMCMECFLERERPLN